jgi:hypothetical protein
MYCSMQQGVSNSFMSAKSYFVYVCCVVYLNSFETGDPEVFEHDVVTVVCNAV